MEEDKCPVALKTALQMMPSECGNIEAFVTQLGQLMFGLQPSEIPTEAECRRVQMKSIMVNPKRAMQFVLCRLRAHLNSGMDADAALTKAWEETNAKL